jgi:hypothetical protein
MVPPYEEPGDSHAGSPLDVQLGRVCSIRRSEIPYPQVVFFEEAKNPILSFEIITSSSCSNCSCGNSYSTKCNAAELLESISLRDADLLRERFRDRIWLDVENVKREYPRRWRQFLIKAAVCDDSNQNGLCSDERAQNQLSVNAPVFALDHIPSALNIDVWNGRHFTLATDPDVCEKQYSPLILDLSGDGFLLTGPENGVAFDLSASGRAVSTAWIAGKDDALLVRDLNGNGRVDDGSELFGNATKLKSGKRAANGFEALRDLDDNGDNLFSRKDRAYRELRLWIDSNHNGFSEKK